MDAVLELRDQSSACVVFETLYEAVMFAEAAIDFLNNMLAYDEEDLYTLDEIDTTMTTFAVSIYRDTQTVYVHHYINTENIISL